MDNVRQIKRTVLEASRWGGAFWLSRRLTRHALRILCYHGFGVGDETAFRPKLFINIAKFDRRLRSLRDSGAVVVPLQEALRRLHDGSLPDLATVITIDDGFDSVIRYGASVLQKYSMPATVYVTSYYSVKQTPIFRLLVQYIFWKSCARSVHIPEDLHPGGGTINLQDKTATNRFMWAIINRAEGELCESQRVALGKRLGDLLSVDIELAIRSRVFHIMDADQIRSAARYGLDVQLHTHRHRFPLDTDRARAEIVDNIAVLEPLVGNQLHHFCYPSGLWSEQHWPTLLSCGVKSATTCLPGLNTANTHLLALRRWLDADNTSQIEFDAEVAGYSELLRRARSYVHAWTRSYRAVS